MTLRWAVAHRMAMMAANHAHSDTGVARDGYIDVFAALKAAKIFCIAKPLRGLAGAYAGQEAGGPAIMLNSALDEVTIRHTAGHELGHHVFGHSSRADDKIDTDAESLGGVLPDEEKLAEAFAAWFLMPLPAVRAALQRAAISHLGSPEDVHQVACWLGTSFAGTARHLVNLQQAEAPQAEKWARAWRNSSAKIRAAMCGSRTPPPGRVWVIHRQAHAARLHVLPRDTLVFPGGELLPQLPAGLVIHPGQQLSFEPRAAVTITPNLSHPCQLSATISDATVPITVTLVPPPRRSGHDSTWRAPQQSPTPKPEEQ